MSMSVHKPRFVLTLNQNQTMSVHPSNVRFITVNRQPPNQPVVLNRETAQREQNSYADARERK